MSGRERESRIAEAGDRSVERLWDLLQDTFANVPYEWEQELLRLQRLFGRLRDEAER